MLHRRVFMGGAAAALASPALTSPALGAERASREFRIIRDGDDIGSHRLDAVLGPNGFEVAITIRIAVKVLGITAYRYEMDNREVWKDSAIVSIDSKVNDDLILWNFHPYMGPYQAGDSSKNADGFESMVQKIQSASKKPVIITEFGQYCCPTIGECYAYNGEWHGKTLGYTEAIVNVAMEYGVSWTPWAWRPGATKGSTICNDMNAVDGSS